MAVVSGVVGDEVFEATSAEVQRRNAAGPGGCPRSSDRCSCSPQLCMALNSWDDEGPFEDDEDERAS